MLVPSDGLQNIKKHVGFSLLDLVLTIHIVWKSDLEEA
jgi:hypothetical protein